MTNGEMKRKLISVREDYIAKIKAELAGPGSEFAEPDIDHELISASPISRYSVGILFPQGDLAKHDNDEVDQSAEEGISEELLLNENEPDNPDVSAGRERADVDLAEEDILDDDLDEEVNMSTQYKPSSMGLTFLAKGSTDFLKCRVRFATYRKATVPDCCVPYEPEDTDHYMIPPEFEEYVTYDKTKKVLRLKSQLKAKEVRDIFERDMIPEKEEPE